MNTLPSKIGDALLLQYADDTTLVCSGADPATTAGVMNQQLASIYDWLVEHRMRLNVHKSHVMWFQVWRCKLQHPYPQVLMNGVTLQTTEQMTYLGLKFDTCLLWDSQVFWILLLYSKKLINIKRQVFSLSCLELGSSECFVFLFFLIWLAPTNHAMLTMQSLL